MRGVHEVTSQKSHLDSAHRYANIAIELFFGDGCPQPKATSQHDPYEAITWATR